MRRINMILFVLSLLVAGNLHAQDVGPAALEYWFDADFANRQSVPATDALNRQIDVSPLCTGIHTLEMRVSDTKGRWGTPLLRFFLKSDNMIASNSLDTYTYCFDNDWSKAVSGKVKDVQTFDIDISSLCEGIHSLQFNISDSQGRNSQTLLRYFLAFGEDPTHRELTRYRYWIDNFDQVKEGTCSNGNLTLDIDVAKLCKGIHSLSYQVADNSGRWSAPLLRYFLIPDLHTGVGELTAYEYWFNHGPRHRVETAKQSALDLNNVLIEVKDIVPNGISDSYTFNAADEMVMTPDDVLFGLQVFNGEEQGSQAVLSDTFAISVPVNPHFLALNNNEQLSFDAPGVGMMQGLKTQTKNGQQLSFSFDIQGAKVDFYDTAGNVLAAEREMSVAGGEVYHVEAADDIVYALIYDVSDAFEKLTVSLSVAEGVGIDNLLSGLVIHAEKGKLVICSQRKSLVTVVNAAGRLVFCDTALEGKRVIELPKGIYIVKEVNGYVKKVLVP